MDGCPHHCPGSFGWTSCAAIWWQDLLFASLHRFRVESTSELEPPVTTGGSPLWPSQLLSCCWFQPGHGLSPPQPFAVSNHHPQTLFFFLTPSFHLPPTLRFHLHTLFLSIPCNFSTSSFPFSFRFLSGLQLKAKSQCGSRACLWCLLYFGVLDVPFVVMVSHGPPIWPVLLLILWTCATSLSILDSEWEEFLSECFHCSFCVWVMGWYMNKSIAHVFMHVCLSLFICVNISKGIGVWFPICLTMCGYCVCA